MSSASPVTGVALPVEQRDLDGRHAIVTVVLEPSAREAQLGRQLEHGRGVLAVEQPVVVRVGVGRVGAEQALLLVGETVAVGVDAERVLGAASEPGPEGEDGEQREDGTERLHFCPSPNQKRALRPALKAPPDRETLG